MIGSVKVESTWCGRNYWAMVKVSYDNNRNLKLVINGHVIKAQTVQGIVRENEIPQWKEHCKEKAFPLVWRQYGNILSRNGVIRTERYEPTSRILN